MRTVCPEWTDFPDLSVLKVHPDLRETPDSLGLLVFLVKSGFLVNLERWGNPVFLVKTVWTVCLETTELRAPEEREAPTGFLESLGRRATKDLRDHAAPPGREEKLVCPGREEPTGREETEEFPARGAQTDPSDQRERRETRVKLELGDCQELQETSLVSSLNPVNLENLARREKREIKENPERLVREVYPENKALKALPDFLALKVTLDFRERLGELETPVLQVSLERRGLGVCQETWVCRGSLGLRVRPV